MGFNRIIRYIKRKKKLYSQRKKNKNKDFTLISQNCIGGVIYNNLGLEFKTPTINMFIEDENFVKLVENFEYYMSITPKAKCECFIEPKDNNIKYPKIAIDDIEICCLHYKSCAEAIEAWERRKKRINYDNIYVIGNSWNMHSNEELIKRLSQNRKYKTILFTTQKYPYENCIKLEGDFWKLDARGIVRPDIVAFEENGVYRYFERFFDYVDWLN